MLHERPCSGGGNTANATKREAIAIANFLAFVIPSAVEGSWFVLLLATDCWLLTTVYVNFTATGSRSPSGASKNCRSLNPNMPARTLVGKLWILVFRSRTTAL